MIPRWKVACINWGHPGSPKAAVYLLIGGDAHMSRYFPTWADAIAWLDQRAALLEQWAIAMHARVMDGGRS